MGHLLSCFGQLKILSVTPRKRKILCFKTYSFFQSCHEVVYFQNKVSEEKEGWVDAPDAQNHAQINDSKYVKEIFQEYLEKYFKNIGEKKARA